MTTFQVKTRAAMHVLFPLVVLQALPRCHAFSPASPLTTASIRSNVNTMGIQSLADNMMQRAPTTRLNMMDPSQILTDASGFFSNVGTDNLLSFSDQGQNLAGIFFQASLLPYLTFLYFLSFRGNRIPEIGNFGFQFLLLFVLSTIPSGIVTKGTYGVSLADCDWLHGGAEALLTITNILIVFGFRQAMSAGDESETQENKIESWKVKAAAIGSALAFAGALAVGPGLGFGPHSAFLLGLGNLPSSVVESLPWVSVVVRTVVCVYVMWLAVGKMVLSRESRLTVQHHEEMIYISVCISYHSHPPSFESHPFNCISCISIGCTQ
jgi:Protein of unknown function (DUF3593).